MTLQQTLIRLCICAAIAGSTWLIPAPAGMTADSGASHRSGDKDTAPVAFKGIASLVRGGSPEGGNRRSAGGGSPTMGGRACGAEAAG